MTTIARRRVRRLAVLLALATSLSAAAPALAVPWTVLCPSRLSSMENPVTGEHVCVS